MADGAPQGTDGGRDGGASPRQLFRVLVRDRAGSNSSRVVDVQLQVRRSGAIVWAYTFSDPTLASELQDRIERDLDELDVDTFRRAHRVSSDL
jgi:hypothetical protein